MSAPSLAAAVLGLAGGNGFAEVDLGPGPVLGWAEALGEPLGRLLRREMERIGTTEVRVAASLVQLGVAERLWAVRLGLWARHDRVLETDALGVVPDAPRWRFAMVEHAAGPLGDGPETTVVEHVGSVVLDELRELHDALRAHCRIADGVLWGNAATGLVTQTRRHVLGPHHGSGRRMLTARNLLLARPPLRGRLDGVGPDDGDPVHVRRSCCLYYRSRAARTCGDCPLTGSTAVRRRAGAGR